jgi:hypothetical protein
MPRRRRSSLSTISSWRHTSLTESSCSRANQPFLQRLHRKHKVFSTSICVLNHRFFRPQSLLTGMNQFLASLEITFRRDPTNFRPRVNKMNSLKDREQKCTLYFSRPTHLDLTFLLQRLATTSSLRIDCISAAWARTELSLIVLYLHSA